MISSPDVVSGPEITSWRATIIFFFLRGAFKNPFMQNKCILKSSVVCMSGDHLPSVGSGSSWRSWRKQTCWEGNWRPHSNLHFSAVMRIWLRRWKEPSLSRWLLFPPQSTCLPSLKQDTRESLIFLSTSRSGNCNDTNFPGGGAISLVYVLLWVSFYAVCRSLFLLEHT